VRGRSPTDPQANGDLRLKELIERSADLDRKIDEKMIFEDTAQGWLPAAA